MGERLLGVLPVRGALPLLAGALVVLACACSPAGEGRDGREEAAARAYCGAGHREVEARIDAILAELTVEERAGLLHGASIMPVDGTWLVEGVDRLAVPGLHMLDGPRGLSKMSGRAGTAFPVAMMRAATWDPDLERRVGAAIAREVLSVGGDVLLAPTVNLLRHPRWGRAQETYGEDPVLASAMAVGFVEGVQAEGVLAAVKHFAANSIEDTRHEVDVLVDDRALHELYLPQFRRVVQEGRVAAVMSAYNRLNGAYCDLSAPLLTGVLRDEWRFQGFVVSDWILGTHGDAEALRAGLDVEMPSGSWFSGLPAAVDRGDLTEEEVDRAVRRVLRAQLCFGLDQRERTLDDPTERRTAEHRALALEAARRGIVLLRNEPSEGSAAPVLPLDRGGLSRLVVLGRVAHVENIGDLGSSAVTAEDVVTAFEGLRDAAGPGVEVTLVEAETLDAEEEASVASADAAVVVTGLTAADEGEGDLGPGDRASLALPAGQVALVRRVAALNPATVVVLEAGAAVTAAEWVEEVEALLFAFYPGEQGGRAIAEVLLGDAAPEGRLPFTVPVDEADLPAFDNVSPTVTYDLWHGYRHLEREGRAPLFAFGSGLAYTRFEYESLILSAEAVPADGTLEARVTVTNVGARAGVETVQLYVAALGSRVERAEEELRAFGRLALEPGETGELVLEVRAEDLAFYDVGSGRFEVEPIAYETRVGPSAGEARLVDDFRVE